MTLCLALPDSVHNEQWSACVGPTIGPPAHDRKGHGQQPVPMAGSTWPKYGLEEQWTEVRKWNKRKWPHVEVPWKFDRRSPASRDPAVQWTGIGRVERIGDTDRDILLPGSRVPINEYDTNHLTGVSMFATDRDSVLATYTYPLMQPVHRALNVMHTNLCLGRAVEYTEWTAAKMAPVPGWPYLPLRALWNKEHNWPCPQNYKERFDVCNDSQSRVPVLWYNMEWPMTGAPKTMPLIHDVRKWAEARDHSIEIDWSAGKEDPTLQQPLLWTDQYGRTHDDKCAQLDWYAVDAAYGMVETRLAEYGKLEQQLLTTETDHGRQLSRAQ